MKYFSMIGTINQDMIERFMPFFNDYQDQPITIVLNTSGGSYYHTEALVHMIKSLNDVTIIVQGAYSAGFILLFYLRDHANLILSKTSRGMWHYGKWDLTMSDKNTPYYNEDVCIIKNLPIHRKESERIARETMTPDELKKFMNDEDVYFSYFRMKKIFKKAKRI